MIQVILTYNNLIARTECLDVSHSTFANYFAITFILMRNKDDHKSDISLY